MKSRLLRCLLLAVLFCGITNLADAQRKSTKRTTKTKTKAKIQAANTATAEEPPPPPAEPPVAAAVAPPPANDSLPIVKVKPSLRPDEAVETITLKERVPLAYEHLRADDAVWRHRIWREIDAREKINLPFMYPADEDNGNQRFIQILLGAIQDSLVTVFEDDRFTTPMTKADVAKAILGEEIEVPDYDSLGNLIGTKKKRNEVNWDSLYRFHVKEEVIFDKESSRLFWRILGIAPIKDIILSSGMKMDGYRTCFWVYYPDMRPIFSKYEVYNGKNYGARISWDELFESRLFSGRIIQSSMDNPRNLMIKNMAGMDGNGLLQLYEGENIKDKIFTYEQDLWSY
jgi:gliding motility associated protien GldN